MLASTPEKLKTGSMLHILWILGLSAPAPALTSGVPNFLETESSLTVVEGQTAVLPCSVENLGNSKVAWMNKVQILTMGTDMYTDDPRMELRTDNDVEWNLVLRQVRLADKGEYSCEIREDMFSQTLTLFLNVVAPARILDSVPSGDISVEEGDDVLLTCNVTGSPSPQVTWSRYDVATGYARPASLCDSTEQSGALGEHLRVPGITGGCGGFYRCAASNGIAGETSRRMFVAVQTNDRPQPKGKPTVRLPSKREGGRLGQDVILLCFASSTITTPDVVWMHRGSVVVDNEKHSLVMHEEGSNSIQYVLMVRNVQAEDFGTYTCLATNELGCDTESVELYEDKDGRN